MNLLQIIQSEYVSAIAGGIGGVITAWLTQRVLNKRGTFTYFVNHQRVGMSTEDVIFGTVAVSWNNNPVSNLYLSTIELKNESMNDYENVVVRAYTDNTRLLTEQTQVVGTPNILQWSEDYKKQLHVEAGASPSENQWAIYNGQREYIVPIMNRGQAIKLTYLNSPNTTNPPTIWLAVMQKGVRLKFRVPQNQILGVPQPRAALAGVVIGVAAIFALVWQVSDPWVIAAASLTYGLVAQVPGAYGIKILRKLREAIGG
ncbi:hypothetical protein [Methyloversatilis discipulorum]|uniref:hypothetical protein n=1 Tax=Methyloversatilis discipulorum TaxID=1119528 RepID=UPI0012FA2148|nr:hypothetical protein [Methyloversatilis discipulorum]